MTGIKVIGVVVCAGGLGTRIAGWARYIPKEFFPVEGRPGIVHLLEEISALGPAEVVIVCHPYYDTFTTWARAALSPGGHDSYQQAARLPAAAPPAAGLTVSFITQQGPYADITSVLNGAGYLASREDLYVAFADNIYRGANPLLALQAAPPRCPAVLARAYQPELAASRGVIATRRQGGQLLMIDLAEKPAPHIARALERRYGTANLLLLEGRARLTADFTGFARSHRAPVGTEPKLALALAAYARTHPVFVTNTSAQVIDLGTHPSARQRATSCSSGTEGMSCGPDYPQKHSTPGNSPTLWNTGEHQYMIQSFEAPSRESYGQK
jgi:UTP-glucose-1-phosphate uridylyltransferase